jgi:hypothetical protein
MFDDALGDIAALKIKELQEQALKKLQKDNDIQPHDLDSVYKTLYKKIEFQWTESDENALVQLREASRQVVIVSFLNIATILDEFYAAFRVPLTHENGQVKVDREGRVLWRCDDHGRPIEDLTQMTGQDIEKALFDLQREKLGLSQNISELFLEALFAKYSFDDTWHEKYESMIEGTNPMRAARANRDAMGAKYKAFFHFYIWHRAQEFSKEIGYLMRLLERVRDWRIREAPRD